MAELSRRAGVSLDVTRRVQALDLLTRGDDGRYSPTDVALLRTAVSGLHMKTEMPALLQGLATVRGAVMSDSSPMWDFALVGESGVVLSSASDLAQVLATSFSGARVIVVPLP